MFTVYSKRGGPDKVQQTSNCGCEIASKADTSLIVDIGFMRSDMEPGYDQHVKHNVECELYRADDQRHIRLIECPGGIGHAVSMADAKAENALMRTYVRLALLTPAGTKPCANPAAPARKAMLMIRPITDWKSINV